MNRSLGTLFGGVALAATVVSVARPAGAQEKISAINSDRGRIVFRNDASFLGIGPGAPTTSIAASSNLRGANFQPQFSIAPSVDVFIIPNLSLGGTIGFTFNKIALGLATTDVFTFFFMPRVGYNVPIVNHFSVWPQFGFGIGVASPSGGQAEVMVPLDLYVPFLFHPVENFFLGIGPGMKFQSLNDKSVVQTATFDFLRFTLGGSVPVF